MPCPYGLSMLLTEQLLIVTGGTPDVDPVEPGAGDGDVVEPNVLDAVDVDPVDAADDGDVADRDPVGADEDAAAHDRARLADEDLSTVDHERPLVHAGGRCTVGGRCSQPTAARGGERRSDRDGGEQSGGTELAPVLRIAHPQRVGSRRGRAAGRTTQAAAEERQRQARAARRARATRTTTISSASSSEPERQRRPARLVGEQPVVELEVERDADGRPSTRRARSATSGAATARGRQAASTGSSAARRDSSRPLSVYDTP